MTDKTKCELCQKETDDDDFSIVYQDILACKICVPDDHVLSDDEKEGDE